MLNEAANQNYSLVLITRPSLQATALLHQIKSILDVNAKIHNINKYLNDSTENTLFLFDLMEADRR
ncbi:MAG: biofilm master transcriptional regulator CsgD, partial [Hafnia alvei]